MKSHHAFALAAFFLSPRGSGIDGKLRSGLPKRRRSLNFSQKIPPISTFLLYLCLSVFFLFACDNARDRNNLASNDDTRSNSITKKDNEDVALPKPSRVANIKEFIEKTALSRNYARWPLLPDDQRAEALSTVYELISDTNFDNKYSPNLLAALGMYGGNAEFQYLKKHYESTVRNLTKRTRVTDLAIIGIKNLALRGNSDAFEYLKKGTDVTYWYNILAESGHVEGLPFSGNNRQFDLRLIYDEYPRGSAPSGSIYSIVINSFSICTLQLGMIPTTAAKEFLESIHQNNTGDRLYDRRYLTKIRMALSNNVKVKLYPSERDTYFDDMDFEKQIKIILHPDMKKDYLCGGDVNFSYGNYGHLLEMLSDPSKSSHFSKIIRLLGYTHRLEIIEGLLNLYSTFNGNISDAEFEAISEIIISLGRISSILKSLRRRQGTPEEVTEYDIALSKAFEFLKKGCDHNNWKKRSRPWNYRKLKEKDIYALLTGMSLTSIALTSNSEALKVIRKAKVRYSKKKKLRSLYDKASLVKDRYWKIISQCKYGCGECV